MSLCLILSSRPLEDELFAVTSELKRPVLESSISMQAPNTSVTSKELYSCSDRVPAATSQTPLSSAADPFVGRPKAQSDSVSHAVQKEPQSRKRKEMVAEIQMDELESIMSEDMDGFEEQPSGNQSQLIKHSSTEQKQSLNTVESSSKRQRVHLEENGTSQRPHVGLQKESDSHKNRNQKSEHHIASIKKEQVDPFEYKTTYESSKPEVPARISKDIEPFEDDDASFVEVRIYMVVFFCSSGNIEKVN